MNEKTIDAIGLCVVWTLKGAATLGLLLYLPVLAQSCGREPALAEPTEVTKPGPSPPGPKTYPPSGNFHSL